MWMLLSMFATFLAIGAVAFGGGYAMLPLFERMIVDTHGWLTMAQFLDMLAIAQITPGPISINSATFIGFQLYGVLGAAVATVGIVTVPVLLISLISMNQKRFKESRIAQGIFVGLRPAFVGLIFASVYSVADDAYVDITSVFLFVFLLVLLKGFKLHPILVILVSAIAGYILYI
ncbi:MAG: chromate transporter [Candidatus Izemoplasmataceae bacterium]